MKSNSKLSKIRFIHQFHYPTIQTDNRMLQGSIPGLKICGLNVLKRHFPPIRNQFYPLFPLSHQTDSRKIPGSILGLRSSICGLNILKWNFSPIQNPFHTLLCPSIKMWNAYLSLHQNWIVNYILFSHPSLQHPYNLIKNTIQYHARWLSHVHAIHVSFL